MNTLPTVDLTTYSPTTVPNGILSVGAGSSPNEDGSETSGMQSVDIEFPVHMPMTGAMESHSMEWWTRPTKIGLWTVEDVLTIPVDNSWDVRGHFSEPIMNFMMAHAHSVVVQYNLAKAR